MNKNVISVCARKLIEAIPLLLFINLIYQILWLGYCGPNEFLQSCYSNLMYLTAYFALMVFGLIYAYRDRITKLIISMKDGIHAELQQVQKKTNEAHELAIKTLALYVTQMENARRWGGWSDERYKKELLNIKKECEERAVAADEYKKIFATTAFWEKIDALFPTVNLIQNALETHVGQALQVEWDNVVHGAQELSAGFLTKYLDKSSLDEPSKSKLRSEIAKFNKDLP